MKTKDIINLIEESKGCLTKILNEVDLIAKIEYSSDLILNTIRSQSMFSYGNGELICHAMHITEELSSRFSENKRVFPSIAIFDPLSFTIFDNDYGFEYVF